MMLARPSPLDTPNKADARALRAFAVLHSARLNVEVETLEVLLQDEVHDTGDGVGAIHR